MGDVLWCVWVFSCVGVGLCVWGGGVWGPLLQTEDVPITQHFSLAMACVCFRGGGGGAGNKLIKYLFRSAVGINVMGASDANAVLLA